MSNCWTFPLKEIQLLTPAALFSGLRCHGDKNSSSHLVCKEFEGMNDFLIAFSLFIRSSDYFYESGKNMYKSLI